MAPVQRRIEPRSADDSLSGVVRCLYFADTFLRDGKGGTPMEDGDLKGKRILHQVVSVHRGKLGLILTPEQSHRGLAGCE